MLWPWNAARAASKRSLPKPRKMHAPVAGLVHREDVNHRAVFDDVKCHACGYHICACDRLWEEKQEAQRAALAINVPAFLEGYYSVRPPPVQNHLRHGDPRRMSLGYNERDYDESRRVTIKAMKAERDALLADPERGLFEINVGDRLHMLCHAIAEHERKLPLIDPNMPLIPLIEPTRPVLPGAFTYNFPVQVGYEHGHYGRNNPDSDGFLLNLESNAGKQITVTPEQKLAFEKVYRTPPKGFGFSDSWDLLSLKQMLDGIEKL